MAVPPSRKLPRHLLSLPNAILTLLTLLVLGIVIYYSVYPRIGMFQNMVRSESNAAANAAPSSRMRASKAPTGRLPVPNPPPRRDVEHFDPNNVTNPTVGRNLEAPQTRTGLVSAPVSAPVGNATGFDDIRDEPEPVPVPDVQMLSTSVSAGLKSAPKKRRAGAPYRGTGGGTGADVSPYTRDPVYIVGSGSLAVKPGINTRLAVPPGYQLTVRGNPHRRNKIVSPDTNLFNNVIYGENDEHNVGIRIVDTRTNEPIH